MAVHGLRKEECFFNTCSFVLAPGVAADCATIFERPGEDPRSLTGENKRDRVSRGGSGRRGAEIVLSLLDRRKKFDLCTEKVIFSKCILYEPP